MVAAADWREAMVWKGEDVVFEARGRLLAALKPERERREVEDAPPALRRATGRAVWVLGRRNDFERTRLTADMMFSRA